MKNKLFKLKDKNKKKSICTVVSGLKQPPNNNLGVISP